MTQKMHRRYPNGRPAIVCYALLEEFHCATDMYNMYGSAVEEEDYELLMLIADEMTSNILHII